LDVARYGGGYVLLLFHPDLTWLLCWVGVSIVGFLVALATYTWRMAYVGARPWVGTSLSAVRTVLLTVILPMALGTVAGAVRLYSDRIYGLRRLPLAEAGVYATAFAFAGGVGLVSSQVSAALVPALFESGASGRDAVVRKFLRSYTLVVSSTVALGAALLLALPYLAGLMNLDPSRSTMLSDFLPLAVAAVSVAAIAGPSYAWALAERRYTLSGVSNVGGAVLVVLYLLLVQPSTGTQLAVAAAISSASYAAVYGVALTRPLGGSLSCVEGFLFQIPTWLGLILLGNLTWLSV
jgi:O-antigen/teichoic acid export membrane protein